MHKVVKRSVALVVGLASVAAYGQRTKSLTPVVNPIGAWKVQSVRPTDIQGEFSVQLTVASGHADLYIRRGSAPTLTQYDIKVTGSQTVKTAVLRNIGSPALTSENWFIGAYSKAPSSVTITPTLRTVRSDYSGKGAVPFARGTTFRTWAPNASSVHVAGQFNNWSTTAAPMVNEGGGWWSLDIRNANVGQQYKFVIRNGSSTIWKNDPYARRLTNSVGNSIIYNPNGYAWQTTNFVTPQWNNAVIYQMHIGTYNDSPGGSPGTFSSAVNRLDHIRDLGANVIKLLPVQEFAGDFSWGYNPSHVFSVESAYGGPDNLKRFIDEANKRGIAVLLDVVHNHYGPSDLDLWRFDGWSQGSYGGIFFYNDARAVTPWGNTRPDFGRSEVRQFIIDNQRQWAEEFRFSGFRVDSTLTMRTTDLGDNPDGWSLLQWMNNDLDFYQPWKIMIAEDLQNNSWITRDTQNGGAGFDSQWSNFVHTVRANITPGDDNSRNMWNVRDAIAERFNNDAFERVIYTESHDENANGKKRVTSTIDDAAPGSYWSQKRSTLGAALVMTAPGIPMIFQGQEILEDGWFADTDPVDWTKLTTYSGIRLLYRDLISLRRNLGGRTAGLTGQNLNVHHVNDGAKVLAFHRWNNGGANDDVIVIANFRNQTWNNYRIGFPRSGNWSVVFNSDWNGYSPLFGNLATPAVIAGAPVQDGMSFSGTVNVAPYSVVILAKD